MKHAPRLIAFALLLFLTACSKRVDSINFGIEGNLACAPAFLAVVTNAYGKPAGVAVKPKYYGAGPTISEALVEGDLDAACIDPVSAAHAALRSKGKLVIVAGVSSGGGALVASGESGIRASADLRNSRVFTPQAGSVHDVVARQAFAEAGFTSREQGGEFEIVPASNLDVVALIRRRNVSAAWTGEPWVSLILEATAGVTIFEQDNVWQEWGNRPDSTSVLVVRRDLLSRRPEIVAGLLATHLKMIDALATNTDDSRQKVAAHLEKVTHRAISAPVFARAWSRVRFSATIPEDAVRWYAQTAHRLGFFGADRPDLAGVFDGEPLKKALENRPR